MDKSLLQLSPEVEEAIRENKPVIALESTIISHGMPYPQNIEVAKSLENISREKGVVPATICLMDGRIRIGLDDNALEALAAGKDIRKVSRRDMGRVLAEKATGATTVAATMIAAHLAGIKVFATGGIGGVHRYAEQTFDISADLIEFSQTPVIVVSAGAKAILDLPKTLEYLETFGVPVYGYQTDTFPAFYSRSSNLKLERIDSAREIARIYQLNRNLDFQSGILVANPIPQQYEIPFEEMNGYIKAAITEAKELGITGQGVTPFLLSRLVEITQGRSLQANIRLVENNVRLAGEIAKEL